MDPEESELHRQKLAAYRADAAIQRDGRLGMDWWNELSEADRARWLGIAQSSVPAHAWEAFKRATDDKSERCRVTGPVLQGLIQGSHG